MGAFGAGNRRKQIVCTKDPERRIWGCGSCVRMERSGVWVMHERGRGESEAWGRSCRCADLVKLEQGMGGNESVVRRNRIRGWVMLWRRMGGISAFVRRNRSGGLEVTHRTNA